VSAERTDRWVTLVLRVAAVYNVVWGASVVLMPGLAFDLFDMEPPAYPAIWQCVGMIVGVYGVGYWVAARDPLRHWPIVLVGLLGKVFGPIGFVYAASKGELPWAMGWTIVTNDLIWWVPFGAILYQAHRASFEPDGDAMPVEDALEAFGDDRGRSIATMSSERPVLLVLLRHAGCTFCKEAVRDIKARRGEIEREGAQIVLVHMGDDEGFRRQLEPMGLGDVALVSDPERVLYRSLGLGRGRVRQLFGPRVWVRGIVATLRGNMIGRLVGDGFQMPGVFLIENGRIVQAFRHETVSDRPDYSAMACGV